MKKICFENEIKLSFRRPEEFKTELNLFQKTISFPKIRYKVLLQKNLYSYKIPKRTVKVKFENTSLFLTEPEEKIIAEKN